VTIRYNALAHSKNDRNTGNGVGHFYGAYKMEREPKNDLPVAVLSSCVRTQFQIIVQPMWRSPRILDRSVRVWNLVCHTAGRT